MSEVAKPTPRPIIEVRVELGPPDAWEKCDCGCGSPVCTFRSANLFDTRSLPNADAVADAIAILICEMRALHQQALESVEPGRRAKMAARIAQQSAQRWEVRQVASGFEGAAAVAVRDAIFPPARMPGKG